MREHSIIRHTLMALCAYLAVGVAMAQSGGPAVSLAEAQRGAMRGMTDCQAVLAVAHGLTRLLGAEELARELMELPVTLDAILDWSPESLRELAYEVVGK
jgi:hypothetical protein